MFSKCKTEKNQPTWTGIACSLSTAQLLLGRSARGFGTGHSPWMEPNLTRNMLSCRLVCFRNKLVPRRADPVAAARTRHQRHQQAPDRGSGLVVTPSRPPASGPLGAPHTPSRFGPAAARAWPSSWPADACAASFRDRAGRAGGKGANSPTGVKSLWTGCARAGGGSCPGPQHTPV